MWRVDEVATEQIAVGAGILGTGGGGNPYLGKTQLRRLLREGAEQPRVVAPDEVPDDALICTVGGMGAPTVGVERLARGDEWTVALRTLERHLGRSIDYVVPGEIGGANATRPLVCATQTGLPVIDGDGMGRAFPELQMKTFSIYGVKATPAVICDVRHNTAVFPDLPDTLTLERYARAVTIQMGGHAGYAFVPMTGAQLKRTVIPGTMTLARDLGAAIELARQEHRDPIAAALGVTGGEALFGGKIADVERRMAAGFARGAVRIDGLGAWRGATLRIDFQNENLIARRTEASGVESTIAIVPDLICIVDSETAAPVTTEVLRYGLRVAVLGIPAPPLLRTPEALDVVGPRAFGYDDEYLPLPGAYGQGASKAAREIEEVVRQ
jgi:DUF917 family protein